MIEGLDYSYEKDLHLAVSVRSFRAEKLSQFINELIAGDASAALHTYDAINASYPIVLTRCLSTARSWLRRQARGSERYGLVASSGALRLKPEGIHVKADIDAPNWFLNSRDDVRSSYYLEDPATEFAIQGLELDWVGMCWDADFRRADGALVVPRLFGSHLEKYTRYEAADLSGECLSRASYARAPGHGDLCSSRR
jgi:hypothetical protein